ncbi:S-adenosylmethionine-diacylgycerolhomoserine-N-methyltransferase [Rhizobium sp. PP-F2F-G48]|uniref:class I SAM-dependent methyltransferase n=1 Tax=Rhizobium sp. PP-F2F-G48 TaxID=2135651 RepID=UPI00104CD0D4|nr:class I SAM-dependent methyltransferase [Rhizobium sp. PP-F2F-G48]TCM58599.1 S-adenosylmethionine-diacylgycerolhomoserine-N-methyltransferase [Rhizobium sp. PP-F2F-G48]
MTESLVSDSAHAGRMDRMYRTQRHIYDATRKYYLFGRDTLIDGLDAGAGARVLEVGCGTGRNLALIAKRYPQARLYGLDISAEMLISAEKALAGRAATLKTADATDFEARAFGVEGFERIVISYALSMIPDWEKAIDAALDALAPDGSLHIADFGQQEGLPPIARRILSAWLTRFHVTPRARLMAVVTAKARARGLSTETKALGRGYAWLVICRRT